MQWIILDNKKHQLIYRINNMGRNLYPTRLSKLPPEGKQNKRITKVENVSCDHENRLIFPAVSNARITKYPFVSK